MSISLEGDQPFENIPSIKAKALRINLNEHIYGTFAEIGAGQEVARHFFRSPVDGRSSSDRRSSRSRSNKINRIFIVERKSSMISLNENR